MMVIDKSSSFDAKYYGKYYDDRRTRVHGAKAIARLCNAVTSFVEWWGHPLETVLDVGAGIGLWRDWFKKNRPKTRYRSTEYSAYACKKYGHERRDISKWRADESFDLVVCQGVLPYLDDAAAASALENLASMTGGFLYLEAITKRDVKEVCDDVKTDVAVHLRTGAWYRKRMSKHFVEAGCGLWCKREAGVLFYELEASATR